MPTSSTCGNKNARNRNTARGPNSTTVISTRKLTYPPFWSKSGKSDSRTRCFTDHGARRAHPPAQPCPHSVPIRPPRHAPRGRLHSLLHSLSRVLSYVTRICYGARCDSSPAVWVVARQRAPAPPKPATQRTCWLIRCDSGADGHSPDESNGKLVFLDVLEGTRCSRARVPFLSARAPIVVWPRTGHGRS